MKPHFFERRGDLHVMKNRLPHWHQAGGIYFVTFRLADALPAELLRTWRTERQAWLRRNPVPLTAEQEMDYHRRFVAETEHWLDAGHGSCVLRDPATAEIVAKALHFHEGGRSEIFSFVVMPNHIHALIGLLGGAEIQKLVGSWKGATSYKLARRNGATWPGWQKDYFDRLVRDEEHFVRCVRYIRRNPAKAGLREGEFVLWESERAKVAG